MNVRHHGPRPFVTRRVLTVTDAGGERGAPAISWDSRRQRKGADRGRGRAGVWWRPDRRNWWMAVLFSVGSLCFVAGGIASEWALSSPRAAAWVFFVGSLFFTTAAYLQWNEAVLAGGRGVGEPAGYSGWRPASWEPKRIDWIAGVVQLAGTILFNLSTGLALGHHLTSREVDVRVWAPDIFGSIAFLVSSQLAYAEVCHSWLGLRVNPRGMSWRIVVVNLVGSGAFGVSAIGSLVEPRSGTPVDAWLSNVGTWFGALCFLLGALLLIPEAAHEVAAQARIETATAHASVEQAISPG